MAIGMETTTQRGHILPITNNYCAFRVRADVVFGLWAVNFILAARCLNVKLHQIIRVIDVTADQGDIADCDYISDDWCWGVIGEQ